MEIKLSQEVRYLKGVGEVRAGRLARIGIRTVKDLLTYYPARYEDRRDILEAAMVNDGDTALVRAEVVKVTSTILRNRKPLIRVLLNDGSGNIVLLAFNQPYIEKVMKPGETFFIHARFARKSAGLEATAFTYERYRSDAESHIHVERIVPVYGLTEGITQKWLRGLIYRVLEAVPDGFAEIVPEYIRKKEKLSGMNRAVRAVHFPGEFSDIEVARKSLILSEFLVFQTALALRRARETREVKPRKYEIHKDILTPFKDCLGFEFTSGQKKAINEIFGDMLSVHPMRRLLQGDVGCGKTVVALSAILLAVENSYTGVVIAPTEILAEQHYLTFRSYLKGLEVRPAILTGNMKKKEREKLLSDVRKGKCDILVGTHALLQPDVEIPYAGVLVIDEQHRFGVRQKAALLERSSSIDVLAMSATPIPRSVAMSLYGDLDISTIKELPRDRKKPVTRYCSERKAYRSVIAEVKKGNRAYIVHPLIEESDRGEWKSAEKRFRSLGSTVFGEFRCGLLHGRMDSKDKQEVMRSFAAGEYDILFTTTVIEVGIDVPEASVMVIENFDRYGLATLHQLRGRISRSRRRPYCYLTGDLSTGESRKRLDIILNISDGFRIAEEDLKLRGAGELFGIKQHGMMDFSIGDPVENIDLLELARGYSSDIVSGDRELDRSSNANLKKAVYRKFGSSFHLADVS